MACISIGELFPRTSSITIKNERQYQRQWRIETDSTNTGPIEVENYFVAQTGIQAGSYYQTVSELDLGAYALELRTQCVAHGDSGCSWVITVNFGHDDHSGETNPLLIPAEFSWSFSQWTESVYFDVYGQLMKNSWDLGGTGDRKPDLYPAFERQHSLPVLKVKRNEATFDPLYASQLKDCVNANTWLGAPPHCVKVSNIGANSVFDQKWLMTYWAIEYEFMFNLNTFDRIEIDATWNTNVRNGTATEPYLLDGAGGANPSTDPPVFLTFEVYPEVPFTFNFVT